ncbi:2,3-bisphosphoglycerate-dependent phosphoglycerate mutase [Holzapfeliella sp. He02]|uniref:2,3-bisphosphoglycerate-dependent phosphoglycerate mutase n=1 Tax=Holzapfeliella saturejae TaxID=3082953 RepID=A0ABU8SFG4_9LACO
MVNLLLVRHGQSTANASNTYTGWTDVDLTPKGIEQAKKAGYKLGQIADVRLKKVHTSVLKRAIKTANIILEEQHLLYLPMLKSWRLNERHYGGLGGLNKDETRRLYGVETVQKWRRSFEAIPPKSDNKHFDYRYNLVPKQSLPASESLKMASERIIPYYEEQVAQELLAGNDQLIVAHGSTIRALIKYLEAISDQNIDGVEVKNSEIIQYQLDNQLAILQKNRY